MKNNETRVKALRLARHYLQTHGLHGFSFQNIADKLGLRKASLHYYFESKEDLTNELISDYLAHFEKWKSQFETKSAKQKLKAVVVMYTDLAGTDQKICPIGALCADFQALSKDSKQNLQKLHLAQRKWLLETIQQGQKEKYLSAQTPASQITDMFMSLVQGGLQMARLRNDGDIVRQVMTNFIASFES